ncbi:retrovirus-related pol polyprotein from transposon TNT 1-94 [Tanacetum coccineum]
MQDELLQFKLQMVWTLVDLPNGKRAIGTKWVYKNKKDGRDIMIKNKARLVDQGYTQEKRIDYDEVIDPVARIEAIRLFLAYASFKDFVVYQMDVKSDFLYGKIEEEVYVCQPLGFEDPDLPDRVYKVEKALYGLHQAPRAWYETLSTYLLDNGFHKGKIDKTLFIIRDKFAGMSSMGFSDVKTVSTPMETHKPLLKDADGEDVDEHMYRLMIGSLMHLTSSRPDTMIFKGRPKLGLWYPKDLPFDLVAYTDSDYAGANLNRKSITGGIGVNAGDSKLMLLGINLLLLEKVNAARHNLLLLVIVDFLNASSIKYALTVNPTIYTSCIEQFWSTAKAKTVNGEVQLQALVDGKKIVVTEASLTLMGAKTTAWNEFSSTMASAIICLANNQKLNFSKHIFESMMKNLDSAVKFLMYSRFVQVFLDNQLEGMINHNRICIASSHTKKKHKPRKPKKKDTQILQSNVPSDNLANEAVNEENVSKHSNDPLLSGEDRLKLEELMALCTNLQNRVLDLEHTKTTQALEIDSLKRRVKKLDKKQRSRTHRLKRLYQVGLSDRVVSSEDEGLGEEDASKHERKIHDIDADEDITLENVHDEDMFDTCVFNDEEVFAGQDMAKKEVSTADPVTNAGEVVTIANVEVSTVSPTAATLTTVELTLTQTLAELKSARPKTKGVL